MRAPERLGPYVYRQSDACFPLGGDSLALAAFASVRRGDRVCDLGCGAGALPLLLLARESSLDLSGVELDGEAAALARRNLAENGLSGVIRTGDLRRVREQFPAVERIMLGRGLIMDPELGEKLLKIEAEETGMDRVCKETEDGPDLVRLRQFHDALFEAYGELMSGDRNVLFRMKELWAHMIVQFPDSPKLEKRIKKSTRLSEYTEAVNELFKEAGHGL